MFATRHLNTDNQKRVKRIVKGEEDTLANIEQEADMSSIEIAYNVLRIKNRFNVFYTLLALVHLKFYLIK